jgi:hypothetical protein
LQSAINNFSNFIIQWGQILITTNQTYNLKAQFSINFNNVYAISTKKPFPNAYSNSTNTVGFNSMHVDCALINRVNNSEFYFDLVNPNQKTYYIAIGN